MFQTIFNQTALVAPKRKDRPMIHQADTSCPFCLENKNLLAEVVYDKWENDTLIARFAMNKYPVVNGDIAGIHDVVIDTPNHTEHPKDFSIEQWEKIMIAIQERWHQIVQNPKIRFIQVFKNYGRCAGASISHSHWQIIALEQLPYSMKEKYEDFAQISCYFCQNKHNEEGYKIWETSLIEVWAPPTPQYLYEVWFIPKKHHQNYGELSVNELKEVGQFLKYFLEIYNQLSPEYDFNICMMSGDVKGEFDYHFYIKLVMRVGHIAGFEIATGCNIVTTDPKVYAPQMKALLKERIQE